MATRDVTGKFLKLRTAFHRNTEVNRFDDGQDKFASQPIWVHIAEDVDGRIKAIEELMETLEVAHQNRLMIRMNDKDEEARDKEVNEIAGKITKLLLQAKTRSTEVGRSATRGDEDTVCKNVQKMIVKRLQALSLRFHKSQQKYLERLRLLKSGKSPAFLDDGDDEESRPGASGIVLSDSQMIILGEQPQVNIRERDLAIRKIADSIEDLAAIFRDLAELVIEQGTILDRIDYNMDMVVETTKRAVHRINDPIIVKSRSRPIMCTVVLVVLNFVLLAILTFKHS